MMNDRFRGEVYVNSDMDKSRFEDVALRCGWCVAIQPLGESIYKLTFYVPAEEKND